MMKYINMKKYNMKFYNLEMLRFKALIRQQKLIGRSRFGNLNGFIRWQGFYSWYPSKNYKNLFNRWYQVIRNDIILERIKETV